MYPSLEEKQDLIYHYAHLGDACDLQGPERSFSARQLCEATGIRAILA